MNESNQQHSDEKRLWQQFSAQDQTQPTLSDLDPNLLAAYLDSQTDHTQVQEIESLMASNPTLLDELIELRRVQDAGPAIVSQTVIDRAQALSAPQQTIRQTSLWQRFQWAAAAAAVVVACVGGYTVGRTTSQDQLAIQASLSYQASLELDGFTLATIVAPNGSNGGEE